jgi:hypothetical protein
VCSSDLWKWNSNRVFHAHGRNADSLHGYAPLQDMGVTGAKCWFLDGHVAWVPASSKWHRVELLSEYIGWAYPGEETW